MRQEHCTHCAKRITTVPLGVMDYDIDDLKTQGTESCNTCPTPVTANAWNLIIGPDPQRMSIWFAVMSTQHIVILPFLQKPTFVPCGPVAPPSTAADANTVTTGFSIESYGPIIRAAWYVYYFAGNVSISVSSASYNPFNRQCTCKCRRRPTVVHDRILDDLARMVATERTLVGTE